jgi:hypothetical protein
LHTLVVNEILNIPKNEPLRRKWLNFDPLSVVDFVQGQGER